VAASRAAKKALRCDSMRWRPLMLTTVADPALMLSTSCRMKNEAEASSAISSRPAIERSHTPRASRRTRWSAGGVPDGAPGGAVPGPRAGAGSSRVSLLMDGLLSGGARGAGGRRGGTGGRGDASRTAPATGGTKSAFPPDLIDAH
jgi:hypothetical protein